MLAHILIGLSPYTHKERQSPFQASLDGDRLSLCVHGFVLTDYSEIAPTGQTPAHVPHEMHDASSISNFPSPSAIAFTGHSPAQLPHEIHESEITNAITLSSFFYLYPNYNTIFLLIQVFFQIHKP